MKTLNTAQLDRRSFIKLTTLAGGGLMIGIYPTAEALAQQPGAAAPAPTPIKPSTFITINPDNTFTIVAKNPETGQGMINALPQILADEFDVDWNQVKIVRGDLDVKYGNDAGVPGLRQNEGGSTATPQNWMPMRNVGATGRAVMLMAAAQTWGVPESELTTASGVVTHTPTRRTATYASLAAKAATITPPPLSAVKLKDPKDFKVIGKPFHGVENPLIVTGKPIFSIDIEPANSLFAVYEKCPVFGGKAVSANLDEIKKLPGVRHAFVVDAIRSQGPGGVNLDSGVAIVADNWWQANTARKKLVVQWDEGPVAAQSSAGYAAQAKQLSTANASQAPAGGGQGQANIGDVDAVFARATNVVEAEYYFPLLSHAPLEPQNSTAHFKDGKVEIWSCSQTPALANAAVPAGVQNGDVTMHLVRAGGGFGRRLANEYDIEVSKIARLVADERAKAGQQSVPVKLLWSREDDMAHDNYRPAGFHYFKAALDGSGKLTAFRDFVASVNSVIPGAEFPRGYVENFRVSSSNVTPFNIPTGALRAPGTNGVSFVMQSFIDELAYAAKKDPLQFRIDVLSAPLEGTPYGASVAGGLGSPFNGFRARGVLEAVRDMSGWNSRDKLPKGTGMGVAFQYAHAGYVAWVAQVSIDANKKVKVEKAWAAIDIGSQTLNPSHAQNITQGGFVEAMSHMMSWEITIDKGRVQQANFGQYQPTRMMHVPPTIEVKFLKTEFVPTGLGEPNLPPAIPAISNAIFAATGVRIRTMPLAPQGYTWAT